MIKKEHLTNEEHNRGLTFLSLQVSHWPLGAPCGSYGSHFKTWWLSAGRGLNSPCTSSRIQWPARHWGESDYNNTLFAPFCHLHSFFFSYGNFLFGDVYHFLFLPPPPQRYQASRSARAVQERYPPSMKLAPCSEGGGLVVPFVSLPWTTFTSLPSSSICSQSEVCCELCQMEWLVERGQEDNE